MKSRRAPAHSIVHTRARAESGGKIPVLSNVDVDVDVCGDRYGKVTPDVEWGCSLLVQFEYAVLLPLLYSR